MAGEDVLREGQRCQTAATPPGVDKPTSLPLFASLPLSGGTPFGALTDLGAQRQPLRPGAALGGRLRVGRLCVQAQWLAVVVAHDARHGKHAGRAVAGAALDQVAVAGELALQAQHPHGDL